MPDTTPSRPVWPDAIFAHLQRVQVRQVGYVPDAGHAQLIERCIDDPDIADVVLTTEEEGVALTVGAALGGQRAALLMQSSGVGNCVNMFSIVHGFGVPCLLFVTMRGEAGEFNSWQVPMGAITEDVLRQCGFRTFRVETPETVDAIVGTACDIAFNEQAPVAVVLSQQLIGHKRWTR
ncbi:MAG: phosphonopyruvate decarboxylase [Gemmatimonadaceae bacterium]|nr:phosphonopyruvate decarboxylase [Gemmatimonadaceae bacterium]